MCIIFSYFKVANYNRTCVIVSPCSQIPVDHIWISSYSSPLVFWIVTIPLSFLRTTNSGKHLIYLRALSKRYFSVLDKHMKKLLHFYWSFMLEAFIIKRFTPVILQPTACHFLDFSFIKGRLNLF